MKTIVCRRSGRRPYLFTMKSETTTPATSRMSTMMLWTAESQLGSASLNPPATGLTYRGKHYRQGQSEQRISLRRRR